VRPWYAELLEVLVPLIVVALGGERVLAARRARKNTQGPVAGAD
jgi:hypothetical protein